MVTVWMVLVLLGAEGCSKDTDCKGDRVCEQGVCVNPTYVPGAQREGLIPNAQQETEIERPAFEPGWAAFEPVAGMLVTAGMTVLPFYMLFSSGQLGDRGLASASLATTFLAASMASAGVQLAVSNGSRFYRSYAVGPFAAGLLGMGAVLGLYYLTGWLPTGFASGGVPSGGSAALLLVGAIVFVPLLQTAALNIFKTPRVPPRLAFGDPARRNGVALSLPSVAPLLISGPHGASLGVQVSLLQGEF